MAYPVSEPCTLIGVARKLGVHRRQVRDALANAMPRERKYPVRERPRLEPLTPFIDAILVGDQKAPPKQHHTARRIFNRIRFELSNTPAAESTARQYVRERKFALGLKYAETFIPTVLPVGPRGLGGLVKGFRRNRWQSAESQSFRHAEHGQRRSLPSRVSPRQ